MAAIELHAQHLRQSGDWGRRERARLEAELEALLTETLVSQFRSRIPDGRYGEVIDRLVERTPLAGGGDKGTDDGGGIIVLAISFIYENQTGGRM